MSAWDFAAAVVERLIRWREKRHAGLNRWAQWTKAMAVEGRRVDG